MKTRNDPRHKKRERAVKDLFEWSFQNKQAVKDELAQATLKQVKKIDVVIRKAAAEWPLEQINKIDLAILRLAIYELVIQPQEPPKVIIDEAVELAKSYGSEKSSAFINGVLATVFKKYHHNKNEKSAKPRTKISH